MFRSSPAKNMHKIWQNQETNHSLYLGDYYAATNVVKLRQCDIQAVLTVAASLKINHSQNNILHKVINACDMPSFNLQRYFDDAYDWIDQQLKTKNVLVHCAAGISRSSTIVIMYLMKKKKQDLKTTLSYVRSIRQVICPNFGFLKQLERFQRTISLNKIKFQEHVLRQQSKQTSKNIRNSKVVKGFKLSSIQDKQNIEKSKQYAKKEDDYKITGIVKEIRKIRAQSTLKPQQKPEITNTQKLQYTRPKSIRKVSSLPKRTSLIAWKDFLNLVNL